MNWFNVTPIIGGKCTYATYAQSGFRRRGRRPFIIAVRTGRSGTEREARSRRAYTWKPSASQQMSRTFTQNKYNHKWNKTNRHNCDYCLSCFHVSFAR